MDRLDALIISLIKEHNVSEELIYESVNKTLIKHGGWKSKDLSKKIETKRKRRRVVCRPVLLISDSSDGD